MRMIVLSLVVEVVIIVVTRPIILHLETLPKEYMEQVAVVVVLDLVGKVVKVDLDFV